MAPPPADRRRAVAAELDALLSLAKLPLAETFDGTLGISYLEASETRVCASVDDASTLRDRAGNLPLGVCAAIAESVASVGAALAAARQGAAASGLSNDTMLLVGAPARSLVAEGTLVGGASDGQLWNVAIRDGDERLMAVSHVIVAIRPPR